MKQSFLREAYFAKEERSLPRIFLPTLFESPAVSWTQKAGKFLIPSECYFLKDKISSHERYQKDPLAVSFGYEDW